MPTLQINPWGSGASSMEKVSKPTVTSVLILTRAPPQAPDELQEAEIRWGQASEFTFSGTNPRDTSDGTTVTVRPRDPEDPQHELAPLLLVFNEELAGRKVHIVTITDEETDAAIDVARIDQIDFVAPQAVIQIIAAAVGIEYSKVVFRYVLDWSQEQS